MTRRPRRAGGGGGGGREEGGRGIGGGGGGDYSLTLRYSCHHQNICNYVFLYSHVPGVVWRGGGGSWRGGGELVKSALAKIDSESSLLLCALNL